MISKELEAEILRLHHAEKWPVGTIAGQLNVHHDVIKRVIESNGLPRPKGLNRSSLVDDFVPFIISTLERYPRLCASRLYQMVRERGYKGGPDHFRKIVARYRPPRPTEAYCRLRTLPGEQAQVDWAHFGKVSVGKALRPLMGYVLVLSWSRKLFVRFFLNHRLSNFLRGHQEAFAYLGGIPRVILYDNLRSVVLERRGDAIRFHPDFLAFAGYHRFEPRPVSPARGNEKGRVERAIRYVRHSFFTARKWRDLDELNRQAVEWCDGFASDRPCPEDKSMSVGEAFEKERSHLLALPASPFPTDERVEVRVRKTPYVRFDCNDYSVPHQMVGRDVTVLAGERSVRIFNGEQLLVEHERSYDKGVQVEKPEHVQALLKSKRKARKGRGLDRLHHVVPQSRELFVLLAERGENLGSATSTLLRLLDRYGADELRKAVAEALGKGVPHPHSVRQILERRRRQAKMPPPIPVELPDDPRVRNLYVQPHDLKSYDLLKGGDESASEETAGHSDTKSS